MPLTGNDRGILRELILKMRGEAESLLRRHQEAISSQNGEHRTVGDVNDGMQTDEVTGTAVILAAKAAVTVKKADHALRTLYARDFGKCICCDGEIPLSRLLALPFATLCVPCTEEDEREAERVRHTPVYGRDKRRTPASQFI